MMEPVILAVILWFLVLTGFITWQLRLNRRDVRAHELKMTVQRNEHQRKLADQEHLHWKETHQLTAPRSQLELETEKAKQEAARLQADANNTMARLEMEREYRSKSRY